MKDNGTILVVDDEPESLRLLVGILKPEGYEVRPADSGQLALASVTAQPPDMILLDVRMPHMDGFEVCRRLKARVESRDIPLMFISASGRVEERVEGLKLGAVDFISKPFQREELLTRVKTHLDLSRLRGQLEKQVAERTEALRAANDQLQMELAERRRTEQALRESEERFRAIVSQAAVGIAEISPDGKFRLVNDRLCEILGYTQAELLGKNFLDVTHSGDREALLDAYRRLLADENPSLLLDQRCIRIDGSLVWSRLFLSAVRDHNDRPLYSIGVVEDVTEVKEAMFALQESEQRLMMAQRAAHVGIWDRDLGTNVITYSGEWSRLYGLEPGRSSLNLEEWLGLIHPDDRDWVRSLLRNTIERTHVWDVEFRVVWPDESVHWLLGKGRVYLDESGRPARIAGVNIDITERKHAAERFQLAVEAAPNGMVMVNQEGKIVLVNSRVEMLFGYAREELLGQSIEILVPESSREAQPDFLAWYRAEAQGRSIVGPGMQARRKDGTQFPVEIGLNPIATAEGTWVLSSIVDLSERKQAEAALRESEERFRIMADTAPVMIAVSGPDKRATFFNKRWLTFTGRTMEQELGQGWLEALHPDDREASYSTYSASFDARRNCHLEFRLRRANGEYQWLLCDGVPRFGPDGAFAGYIGSAVDITDLKRAQENAAATQKLESLGVLASGIAHDFNNLLGSIVANSELALSELAADAPARDEIQRIRAISIRASEIVGELMIYAGQSDSTFQPVDVSKIVEEMLELLKISISKQATLMTDLGKNLGTVRGDPAQIRQVVMNLVMNASEALRKAGGVISIKTQRKHLSSGDYIQLEVSDTGCGITDAVQARIFDPFFTTKSAGRGLGLAVVAGIVRVHGGDIHVTSTERTGTTFQILLPCSDHPVSEGPIEGAAVQEGSHQAGTVMVVEDESTLRLVVSKALRRRGFSVIEASDGRAAVDLFHKHRADVDAILLDVTLPEMSGLEVLAELRKIRPDVKVILTSAYTRGTVLTLLGDQQVEAFIRKPYPIGDLVRLLQKAMAG